jgi:hypothetical protein
MSKILRLSSFAIPVLGAALAFGQTPDQERRAADDNRAATHPVEERQGSNWGWLGLLGLGGLAGLTGRRSANIHDNRDYRDTRGRVA